MSAVFDELFIDVPDTEQAQIAATGKEKGLYGPIVQAFISSGKSMAGVPLDRGPLNGKTTKQAKSGFDRTRKTLKKGTNDLLFPGGDNVRVRVVDGTENVIYLQNLANSGAAQAAPAADEA